MRHSVHELNLLTNSFSRVMRGGLFGTPWNVAKMTTWGFSGTAVSSTSVDSNTGSHTWCRLNTTYLFAIIWIMFQIQNMTSGTRFLYILTWLFFLIFFTFLLLFIFHYKQKDQQKCVMVTAECRACLVDMTASLAMSHHGNATATCLQCDRKCVYVFHWKFNDLSAVK